MNLRQHILWDYLPPKLYNGGLYLENTGAVAFVNSISPPLLARNQVNKALTMATNMPLLVQHLSFHKPPSALPTDLRERRALFEQVNCLNINDRANWALRHNDPAYLPDAAR